MSSSLEKKVRERIVSIINSFPEAKAVPVLTHLSLEVGRKRIGWYLNDHHGDGRLAVNCKASAASKKKLEKDAPVHFHFPKYLNHRGWVGMWLDLPDVDWKQVEAILREAYTMTAPKSLILKLDQQPKQDRSKAK